MPAPLTLLPSGRIASLDAFRGLTFVLMLFVNFLAGASGIPAAIGHAAASVDGMGLADVVFPAFLFAVGMSIPVALNARLRKGDNTGALLRHVAWRAAGLVVIGVFMVNMESGYNEAAMRMPIALWSLALYAAIVLIWGSSPWPRTSRGAGIALLLALAAVFRSGDGSGWMSTQWWGILGCIGWAYAAASLVYLLARARQSGVAAGVAACIALFAVSAAFDVLHGSAMHATHTSIALAGVLCTLVFFDLGTARPAPARLARGALLALLLAGAGALLHLAYPVSKIGATPPWALYCAAVCSVAFALLFWLTEMRKLRRWTALVEPAATSPLVTYLIPFALGALMSLLHWQWPAALMQGAGAVGVALVFSGAVVALVALINNTGFRLSM
jgi:heparan-alpha-glucosaminide N-acetyltransferase